MQEVLLAAAVPLVLHGPPLPLCSCRVVAQAHEQVGAAVTHDRKSEHLVQHLHPAMVREPNSQLSCELREDRCMCWRTLEPQFHLDKSSTRQMRRILQAFSAVNERPPALPLSSFLPGPLRRLSTKGRQPDPAATERRAGREVPDRAVCSLQPVRHVSLHEGRVRARARVLFQGP